jgi:hypothetical protein
MTTTRARPGSRLAFVLAAIQLATSPAHAQQTPSFGAIREVVRIDVVVVDDSGAPVRGLTAADFQLFEEGRPLPITSFEAVVPRLVPSSRPTRTSRAMPRTSARPLQPSPSTAARSWSCSTT